LLPSDRVRAVTNAYNDARLALLDHLHAGFNHSDEVQVSAHSRLGRKQKLASKTHEASGIPW